MVQVWWEFILSWHGPSIEDGAAFHIKYLHDEYTRLIDHILS